MKIKLNLSDAGIKQAQKEYDEWRKTLETRIEQFVKRLSEMGAEVAKIRFTAAVYDGDMSDIAVDVELDGKRLLFTPPGKPLPLLNLAPALRLRSTQAGCMRTEHTAGAGYKTQRMGLQGRFRPHCTACIQPIGRTKAGCLAHKGQPARMCHVGERGPDGCKCKNRVGGGNALVEDFQPQIFESFAQKLETKFPGNQGKQRDY